MIPFLVALATAAALATSGGGHDALVPAQSGTASASRPPPPAVASISSDVMVLHATNNNSGIDPKIGKIPALSKPPFSSYNSYQLLDQNKLTLDKGKTVTFKLPTGSEMQVIFKDVIAPQKPGDPVRYVLAASVVSGGKQVLPLVEVNAKAGEYFFVGGQTYKGGSLLLGLKVNP